MGKRLNIDYVRASFSSHGYRLISKEYTNAKTKLDYICNKGHEHSITWADWKSGYRCPYCAGNAKLDIGKVKEIFEAENYTVLSDVYTNIKTKIKYRCPEGHEHFIRLDHFNDGIRCPYCSGNVKKTLDFIETDVTSEGYKLISKKYENTFTKIELECPQGHSYFTTYHNWTQGRRCSICNGGIAFDEEVVKNNLASEGYKLISKYKNSNDIIKVVCPNGHIYKVRYNNWLHKNSRCTECSGNGASSVELEIKKHLSFIGVTNILTNTKDVIPPYELDLFLPEEGIGIEYCGLYWHSELNGKNRKYHLNKLELCLNKNLKLITIFEDEFLYRKSLVFSRLTSLIDSSNNKKIYARKCLVEEIETQEARKFCDENHLQGYGGGSTIKLGLVFSGELVSVMTFSKPSVAKGYKNNLKDVWELHRFCSKTGVQVIGGASKLLKHFERNYEWKELFSFADRRWSVGKLYEAVGFKFVSNTLPNYWYFKNKKRIHRFALRKNKNDSKELTEWENRQLQGYDRIWDCGNIKYIKYNECCNEV